MRSFTVLSLAVAAFAVGCSGSSHSPVSPLAAFVRFDSLTTVSTDGQSWQAFAVSNVGQSTAFHVKVYWHFTGQDPTRTSLTQPSDLAKGQTGLAATVPLGNPAWTFPSAPDSIRWAESP